MQPCIYTIIFPNGKCYVGQTIHFRARQQQHLRLARTGADYPVYNAIRFYKEENLVWAVLHFNNRTDLNKIESAVIKQHNTMTPYGYNCNAGGNYPTEISEATRKKLRATSAITNATMSKEVRERMAAATKKRFKNPKVREKLSAKIKETMSAPEYLEGASERSTNLWRVQEVRDKITASMKKTFRTPELRALVAEARKLHLEGLSCAQIGEKMGVSRKRVWSWKKANWWLDD